MSARPAALVFGGLLAAAIGWTATNSPASAPSAQAQPDRPVIAGTSPYDRDEFGPAWADVDRNGCDTRNDILRRDLTGATVDADGCTVLTGRLTDPYTGVSVMFRRGLATSSDVQIDHVYALSDAWQDGASGWTAERREQFANDPANLLATSGPVNQAKGADGPALWAPNVQDARRCAYTARYAAVAAAWGLSVDPADQQAVEDC